MLKNDNNYMIRIDYDIHFNFKPRYRLLYRYE